MLTTLLRMNSLTSAKQLYKHLIRESRKLPEDTQAYYRNHIRQVNIKQYAVYIGYLIFTRFFVVLFFLMK